MADGFIRWYRELGAESVFADQVAEFERNGVTLTHPDSGVISVINVDGDDVGVEFETLEMIVGVRLPSVTTNWWVSSSSNVVGEFSHEPLGCEIQTFWLDGLTHAEVESFSVAVMAVMGAVAPLTRALVCDYRGITDADDWDSPILYGGDKIPGVVDDLLAGPDLVRHILANSTLRAEREGDTLTRLVRRE
ncbi:hypothetical protein [Streptomyces halstedii]|uniref:hypothetical protein n=1 Tax=Streptomyces halstedii TaxID=1944 RepID=UPI003460AA63